ncbi:MAG TPA: hypothetical protein VGE72_00135 [Azospirillum sp.]
MRAYPQAIMTTMFATVPNAPLLRSLRRDWLSWSRFERASAVGFFLGALLSVAFALGVQVP